MFSRRSQRTSRGRSGPAGPPLLTNGLPAAIVREWWRADTGLSQSGGLASAWTGMITGSAFSNAGGATQPAYTASDATLNNQPTLTGDGVGTYFQTTTFLPDRPGTRPNLVVLVLKQNGWTGTRRIYGTTAASGYVLYQNGLTPNIAQFNGSNANDNTGATIGSWFRVAAYYSNTTADYLLVGGGAPVTGASAGNSAPTTGFTIFASNALTLFSSVSIAEIMFLNRDWTAAEKIRHDAYITARYGAGLT